MKFFDFLAQHQLEWRAIKESTPLDFMPYMESHFERLTGVRFISLGAYTGWIKPGSYYHRVVVKQGQLGLCPHLVRLEPPKGPPLPPHHPVMPPMTCQERVTPGRDS